MKEAIQEAVSRVLRGRKASRLLRSLSIDPRRFWLLVDLFGELSDREEILDQLGRNGVALKTYTWIFFGLAAFLSLVLVLAQLPLAWYSAIFLLVTTFFLLFVLLPETANSLVNPAEGLILMHQPINGATYTGAKVAHLARMIFYLVTGLNAAPALLGLALKGSGWFFPFLHMGAAFAVGVVSALLCCALFGWLIRFMPPRRLKAAAQLIGALPFMFLSFGGQLTTLVSQANFRRWLPTEPAIWWALAVTLALGVIAGVALGIRFLSADYLTRVSSMMRGGSTRGSRMRGSRIAAIVSRFFGGQSARAGYAFVSRMMLRDWHFRRTMVGLALVVLIGLPAMIIAGRRIDPFSSEFAPLYFLPHALGFLLFVTCMALPYGADYKGAWIFHLAPSRAFDGFARGIFALLWINVVVIPHFILLPILAWYWGLWHAALFTAFSISASSVYLGLELRLIESAPFSRQMDPARNSAMMLPLMIGGGIVILAATLLQYVLIFRWAAAALVTTCCLGVAAYLVTRSSLNSFATSIRYNLAVAAGETGSLYKEVSA